jgi:glucose-1-phosphatase
MIRAIVLDIGGVLLRTEDPSHRKELEERYDLPPGGADTLVFSSKAAQDSTIGLVNREAIWQNVSKKLSLSSEALENFKAAFWQGDQIDQDLITFLQACRPKYSTALLSNAWENTRQTLADTYNICEGQTVDHILISSELGVAKPDKQIYHILKVKIGCGYSEILFVDDFIENIAAANALNIDTIHYKPGIDLINTIKLKLDQA